MSLPCRVVALVASLALAGCNPVEGLNPLGLPSEPASYEDPAHPRSNDPVCYEGFVRSSVDSLPISDALVGGIGDHTIMTNTDHRGRYSLRCAPHHGLDVLRARKEGWSHQDITPRFVADDGTRPRRFDFFLEPSHGAPSDDWK